MKTTVRYLVDVFFQTIRPWHTSVFPEALVLTAVFDLAVPEKQGRQRRRHQRARR